MVRSVLSPRPIQVGQEQTVLNPPLEGAAGWRHAWASDSEETRFCEPAFPSPADAPFPRSSVTLAAPPGDPSFCITAWLRVPTGALEHTASAGPQAKGLQGLKLSRNHRRIRYLASSMLDHVQHLASFFLWGSLCQYPHSCVPERAGVHSHLSGRHAGPTPSPPELAGSPLLPGLHPAPVSRGFTTFWSRQDTGPRNDVLWLL